jgi:capsular polysaccharide biosynthesis protein
MNQLERDTFRAQIDAASSLGGYSDQVVVLDPAFMPSRPEPPGKTLIVVLAGGAAFVLGLILAFLRALLDSRIFEESDISRIAPVLAVVPKGGSGRWWRR